MQTTPFTGVFTAMITPFRQGKVSFSELESFTEFQISQGVQGLVPVGTTGESPTLDYDEHMDVIRKVIDVANKRVPVIAGTGSNSTTEAVKLTRQAHEAGADGVLQVAPYYNKPSQEGLYRHFAEVADATDRPIVLYSIPGRCGIEIAVSTIERLRRNYPHINHIKEAGGSCDRVDQLRQALGDELTILSGDDSLTLPFMSVGAEGVISVASNLFGKEVVEMVQHALANDFAAAGAIHRRFYPIFKALFIEPNPVPIKVAMARAGLIASPDVRGPLCEMSAANRDILFKALDTLAALAR